jgi:hypothetical protein
MLSLYELVTYLISISIAFWLWILGTSSKSSNKSIMLKSLLRTKWYDFQNLSTSKPSSYHQNKRNKLNFILHPSMFKHINLDHVQCLHLTTSHVSNMIWKDFNSEKLLSIHNNKKLQMKIQAIVNFVLFLKIETMFIIHTSKNMFNHGNLYNIKYIRKECDKSYDAWIICHNCVKK